MEVLFRHTLLGEGIRALDKSRSQFRYAEEDEPEIIDKLVTLEDAESLPADADEATALLTNGDDPHRSQIYLVDWYGDDDLEVRFLLKEPRIRNDTS